MHPVKFSAPAKVNLTLEVLGKRADGYHEVRSVMQAVRLCDFITFTNAPELTFSCSLSGWQAEKSLVSRAANILLAASRHRGGAAINIDKHIPLSSGMGGDSSDCAAVLRGLNELWQLKLSEGRLLDFAASLGSDVPFFLHGGTVLAQGRGERISALSAAAKMWLVIMVPVVAIPESKTAALYARLRPEDFTDGKHTGMLADLLHARAPVSDKQLFNVFEGVVENVLPVLFLYRKALLSAGASNVHLAGSGPALFSLLHRRDEAESVARRLAGWPVYVADTLRPGEGC